MLKARDRLRIVHRADYISLSVVLNLSKDTIFCPSADCPSCCNHRRRGYSLTSAMLPQHCPGFTRSTGDGSSTAQSDGVEHGSLSSADTVFRSTLVNPSSATPYSDATQCKKAMSGNRVRRPMNAFMVWSQVGVYTHGYVTIRHDFMSIRFALLFIYICHAHRVKITKC